MGADMTPAELIKLLTSTSPALRAAGVLQLTTSDFDLRLAPAEPPPPRQLTKREVEAAAKASQPVHPLDDPDTFGGYVPGVPQAPLPARPRRSAPKDEHDDD